MTAPMPIRWPCRECGKEVSRSRGRKDLLPHTPAKNSGAPTYTENSTGKKRCAGSRRPPAGEPDTEPPAVVDVATDLT